MNFDGPSPAVMNGASSVPCAIVVSTSTLAAIFANKAAKIITLPHWARLILWPGLGQRARD